MIADIQQRAAAIDVTRSCIVQAPAGSGKTELLIQRILALLAEVDSPQQILAITFTNKAAAEMRQRLIQSLEAAQELPCPTEPHAEKTWTLAQKALERHGSSLLRHPAQLSIQTIDSFNAVLVRKMPWISRFGSSPEVSQDADALYRTAVETLLSHLDIDRGGKASLQVLLRHLDNNVAVVQKMLVDMLRRRDQWLRHTQNDVDTLRQELQEGLEGICCEHLKKVKNHFPSELGNDLIFCLNFSLSHQEGHCTKNSCEWERIPGTRFEDLPHWGTLANLLLTASGELRKTVTKKNGFPAGKEHSLAKKQMLEVLSQVDPTSVFIQLLGRVRQLPADGYSDKQWQVLGALIELLPLLVAELWLVFRSHGQADFAEIALRANQALGESDNPSDLLLCIDQDLQHILVDEFQDTSRLQYRLLNTLISGWTVGDGRTLFLVGDPMQSIYRFREADVGLFLKSFNGKFGDSQFRLDPLQLCCNFRSQEQIVTWVNEVFASLFPPSVDLMTGAVPLTEAVAVKPPQAGRACQVYPAVGRDDQAEASQVLELIRQAKIEDPDQTIAILVRGRNHLAEILPLLRKHQIRYQAQDIDLLGERPAALDVVHLTSALIHRADRLSWLALLRAPWCGLTLTDLHRLVGHSPGLTVPTLIADESLRGQLSVDGQHRLSRIWPVIQAGLKRYGSLPLRQLVEGCWLAIGGPSCYSEEGCSDAQLVFEIIEELDRGGDLESFEAFQRALKGKFSEPDTLAGGTLQIMTIHKAKGLEFDTVILPGLGKATGRGENPLLRWQEHPQHGLLLAPVSAKGEQDKDPIYQLIAHLEGKKQEEETGRLLYVAATRAIRKLFLLGHADENSRGDIRPAKGSLLEKLWPHLQNEYLSVERKIAVSKNESKPPSLHRLPQGWELPQTSPVKNLTTRKSEIASGKTSSDPLFSGWESPVHRHVGTLVHMQLEQIARRGMGFWRDRERGQLRREFSSFLRSYGVSTAEVEMHVDKVMRAIDTTVSSERGCWILASHFEQKCELPLTGVVEGKVVHAVIDRTFVADGYRWVIDYKMSQPRGDESADAFMSREAKHYLTQLNIYTQLLKLDSDYLPIKAALYFPVIDGWYEYEAFSA